MTRRILCSTIAMPYLISWAPETVFRTAFNFQRVWNRENMIENTFEIFLRKRLQRNFYIRRMNNFLLDSSIDFILYYKYIKIIERFLKLSKRCIKMQTKDMSWHCIYIATQQNILLLFLKEKNCVQHVSKNIKSGIRNFIKIHEVSFIILNDHVAV